MQPPPNEHALFGREEEISALRALLLQAREGHGVTVLISGPGGIGKTSLLRWIDDEAAGNRLRVRWGHCLPSVTDPFFPIDQLFRSSRGGEQVQQAAVDARTEDSGSKESPYLWTQLAAKNEKPLGLPVSMTPIAKSVENRILPPAARAPATVLLDYLSTLEHDVLNDPLVLLLDDFHWADPDSVQALKLLSRNIRNMPVLMAVALREDEVEDPDFIGVLSDLRREALVTDFRLKGLNEGAARQLLESVAQAQIDPAAVRTALRSLIRRTGGNPYFLMETAHQLQEGGKIHNVRGKAVLDLPMAEDGDRAALPVPASVSELLNRRLLALSKDERELLEVASLVGQEFGAAPLKDVVNITHDSTEKMLRKLSAERGLLLQKTGDEIHYAFAHVLLWETVRDSISSTKKREWSEKLATWWEAHEPAAVEKIATLYYEGGQCEKGLNWTEKVIAISLQTHAHQRVARHFATGLSLMGMNGMAVERRVGWGLSVVERLRRDGAEGQLIGPMCRKLIELNPPELLLCNVLLELVNVSSTRVREARQDLSKIQEMVRRRPEMASPSLLGKIAVMDMFILLADGKFDVAGEAARKALSMLPEGETYFRGIVHYNLGWSDAIMARWDEANRNLEQGLMLAKAGNAGGLMPPMLNLEGAIAFVRGDLIRAEEIAVETVEVARNLGRFHMLVTALGNLSNAMTDRGNFDGAEKTVREALRVAEMFDSPLEIGETIHRLGYLRLKMGLTDEAMKFFKMAEKVYAEQGVSGHEVELRIDMAEAKGIAGDPADALKDIAKFDGIANMEIGERVQLNIRKATFLLATNAKEEAKAEIERALAQTREKNIRYFEGKALLLLARWESEYGSPENAVRAQEQADKLLNACGVASTSSLSHGSLKATAITPGRRGGGKRAPHLSLSILRHLADHGGIETAMGPRDVAPLSLTQKGISSGLRIPRNRFSQVLKRLSDRGLITVRTQTIRGETRQMKVYLLTEAGTEALNK